MQIKREQWSNMFNEVARLMIENKDILSEIDAKFGDGDHGITIEKIGNVIKTKVAVWLPSNEPLKSLFDEIGNAVTNISGGSAGPLYGTYLGGFKEVLEDEVEVDAPLLKKIMKSGLTELQYLSTAKVGDKTMMDTLIPATEAAQNAPDDIVEILIAMKDAAIDGAEKSKDFISKFGRAKSYKEQTIGTPDAGATSCTFIFIGFYNAIVKEK
ncbi:DAK2 domain-containing protein [Anaerorhabdus sp.]|uniref:DAK2 domain-containing protein n=1 Tax=Anaerorhabdus sp. TaxID=1872524 RepID=UPI002FC7743B